MHIRKGDMRGIGRRKRSQKVHLQLEQHAPNIPSPPTTITKAPMEMKITENVSKPVKSLTSPSISSGLTSADDSAQFDQLTTSLNDFLLASCLCDLDLVPWLVEKLTSRLRSLIAEFPTFVPKSLYLPAPPVYCPQPTPTNEVCDFCMDVTTCYCMI